MTAGVVAYFYSRHHYLRLIDWRKLVILAAYGSAGIAITSSYFDLGSTLPTTVTDITNIAVRHVLPITLMLAVVLGAALAQIVWALETHLKTDPRMLRGALVGVISLLFSLPALLGVSHNIYQYHLPDSRYLLWQWTDNNIPADGRILMLQGGSTERAWNRYWGGYDGVKTFDWWWIDQNTFNSTPGQFAERGIIYFVTSAEDHQKYPANADAFIQQLTLLKTIHASASVAGPTLYFYRMLPPQVSAHSVFGKQIVLVGYDLDGKRFVPGQRLHFRPYWRIVGSPQTNYSMFVHLYPHDNDQLLSQYDGTPAAPGRLTLTWDDPSELYVGQDITLTVPANLAPGTYRLAVGLYNFSTGQRLSTDQGSDAFVIPITVEDTSKMF